MQKVTVIGLLVTALIILTITDLQSVHSKGLKVLLAVNTDLENQSARVDTFQFGHMLAVSGQFINNGATNIELHYADGLIKKGASFEVCVTAEGDNLRSCGTGYNSEKSKPEYVSVRLYSSIPQTQQPQ
jgi:hypothetical protein